MAKRGGDRNQGNPKKQKTDLEDLWGDDFNIQDVDQCFELASQICEQEIQCTQDASIVPSYTAFKHQTKRVFTSTQSNPELVSGNNPSTSKNGFKITNGINHTNMNNLHSAREHGFKRTYSFENNDKHLDFESKYEKVQDQYYAKVGEVTILRNQLRDVKLQNDKEHMKHEKEWSERHKAATKQLTATKSELAFKDLQIATLKQQVVEKIKPMNGDSSFCSQSQSPFFKHPKNVERCTQAVNNILNGTSISTVLKRNIDKDFTITHTRGNYYPLQHSIESSIFYTPSEEKYLADIKSHGICVNTIAFLQNQLSQELTDRLIQIQPKNIILPNGKPLNIDYIHSDIFNLTKCTTQELEMEENRIYLNKIVCTSEQLIDNLYTFLLELEKGFITNNTEEVDMSYLKKHFNILNPINSLFSPENWLDNEIGKGARQSIACIAYLLPHSNYSRQYLLENKHLIFQVNEDSLKYLPVVQSKLQNNYSNDNHYLNLILSVVKISGKLKNSRTLSGFLCAVCLLLSKIYSCVYNRALQPLIIKLTRELVFVCPNVQVLCYLSEYFKNAALDSEFVNDLCKMSLKGGLKINQKENVIYYKQDVCTLQVFCVLVEYSLSKTNFSKMLELYATVMIFTTNCFKVNPPWMYYEEDKHCGCICKIVKLYVDILYRLVQEYTKIYSMSLDLRTNEDLNSDELSKVTDLLRIGIEVLQIIKFKVDDIIVKYVVLYSQYKVIIKALIAHRTALKLSETDVERLQDLTVIEEAPQLEHHHMDASSSLLWD